MSTNTRPKIKAGRVKVELIMDLDLREAIDKAAARERQTRTAWFTAAALSWLPADLGKTVGQ